MEVDSETELLNLFVVTNCDLDKATLKFEASLR